jgi:hypothetical protein
MRLTFPLRSGAGADDRPYIVVVAAAQGRRSFFVVDGIRPAGSAFPAGGTDDADQSDDGWIQFNS